MTTRTRDHNTEDQPAMRNQQIELDEGENPETVHLCAYAAESSDPADRRLLVRVVQLEGATAPEPAEPVVLHVYADGTFVVAAGGAS